MVLWLSKERTNPFHLQPPKGQFFGFISWWSLSLSHPIYRKNPLERKLNRHLGRIFNGAAHSSRQFNLFLWSSVVLSLLSSKHQIKINITVSPRLLPLVCPLSRWPDASVVIVMFLGNTIFLSYIYHPNPTLDDDTAEITTSTWYFSCSSLLFLSNIPISLGQRYELLSIYPFKRTPALSM